MKALRVFDCLFLLYLSSAQSVIDDASCEDDYKRFSTCAKFQLKPEDDPDWSDRKPEVRKAINDCFTKNGCDIPNLDRNPVVLSPRLQQMASQTSQQLANTPAAVKQCLQRRTLEKLEEKINDCLTKQNVSNVNFSSIDEPGRLRLIAEGQGTGIGPLGTLGADDKTVKERATKSYIFKLNLARAYHQCAENATGNQLGTCLLVIKRKNRHDFCEAVKKPCTGNVSTACQNRSDQIHEALCKCRKDQEKLILQRLDQIMAQANGNVPLGEMVKLLGKDEDPLELIRAAKKCYQDSNVEPPDALNFAEAVANGQGANPTSRSTFQPTVDLETLSTLRDFLAFEALDANDCTACD